MNVTQAAGQKERWREQISLDDVAGYHCQALKCEVNNKGLQKQKKTSWITFFLIEFQVYWITTSPCLCVNPSYCIFTREFETLKSDNLSLGNSGSAHSGPNLH